MEARSRQPGSHSTDGNVHRGCDIRVRHLLNVGQQNADPMGVRKAHQCQLQRLGHCPLQQRLIGRWNLSRPDSAVGRVLGNRVILESRVQSILPFGIAKCIGQDLQKPRRWVSAVKSIVQPSSIGGNERLLDQVFGLVPITTAHPHRGAHKHGFILVRKHREFATLIALGQGFCHYA